ncbi:MAG: DNA recombination/repair protein RecA, partial [Clostridia bacterium]|nr:DNA recombination/repair protein RecA [Clostridia bacterium]
LREKVGVIYGNPEVTTGGRALKFYASVRIDVRRIETIKGPGGEFIGSRTRAKVVKNKVSPPFKEAVFDIMYGTGISKVGELVDLGVEYGVLQKSGAWFSYGETRLGQGRENVKLMFEREKDLAAEIEAKIFAAVKKQNGKDETPDLPRAPQGVQIPIASPRGGSARARIDIAVDDDE